jgi:regulator of PEP synthase PpsR (kinase-PPPase family)
MVRRLDQVPEILGALASSPGYVLHSISHSDVRAALEEGCLRLARALPVCPRTACSAGSPSTPAHDVQSHNSSGDAFDEDYYRRVEAMKYTLAHDDGIGSEDLDGADVIVVGVSRATKTPTCMYLASRGIKAANVPLVPGAPPPRGLLRAIGPLVVGLTVDPTRLAMVRAARLVSLKDDTNHDYADLDALRKEVLDARRLFLRRGWPIIDASHRSIEQTASMIIEMLRTRAGERR